MEQYNKPILDKNISIDDFMNHYWLKKELACFCVQNNISSTGLKQELAERIKMYLKTGIISKVKVKEVETSNEAVVDYHNGPLYRSLPITIKLKRTRLLREFFIQEVGEKFHFTIRLNEFLRDNVGKTLGDAVDDWKEEQKLRSQPGFKSKIVPQCQYNQYIRDYLADNPDKGFKDGVAAWNDIKDKRGNHKYKSEHAN